MFLKSMVSSRRNLVIALAAILLTHASYVPNGFSHLDHFDILARQAIPSSGKLWASLVSRYGETSFYRPIVTLSLSLDFALYGLRAWGYHLTNVLLHVCVCGSFFLILSRIIVLPPILAIFGLIVAGIHPLSWLPVGGISYRSEMLSVLFTFLALWCFVESRHRRVPSCWLVGMGGSTALAILSKETALFWIPAMFLSWECILNTNDKRWSKEWWAGWLVTAAIFVAYVFVRMSAVPEVLWAKAVPLSLEEAICTRLAAMTLQFQNALIPLIPTLSDAMPIHEIGPEAILGAGILFVLVTGALRLQGNEIGWLCAFWIIGLLPALNLLPLPRFTSPHYGYLLSFGYGLALALLLKWSLDRRGAIGSLISFLAGVWCLIAIGSTFSGGSRFADDVSLFGPSVEQDPRHLEGHFFLGYAARKRNDLEKAAEHYAASMEYREDTLAWIHWVWASINLAEIKILQGQLDEAEQLLAGAKKLASGKSLDSVIYYQTLVAQHRKDSLRIMEGEAHRP